MGVGSKCTKNGNYLTVFKLPVLDELKTIK